MATVSANSVTPPLPNERIAIGGVGCALAALALFITAGIPGLVAGALLIGFWLVLPPVIVVAAGHILLVGVTGSVPSTIPLAAFEGGMIAVIAGPTVRGSTAVRGVTIAIIVPIALGAVTVWALQSTADLRLATLTLAAITALAMYGLHRYELVALELVEETR